MITLYCQSLWKAGLPWIWFEAVSTPPPPPWPLCEDHHEDYDHDDDHGDVDDIDDVDDHGDVGDVDDLVVVVVNEDHSMHAINHPPALNKQNLKSFSITV